MAAASSSSSSPDPTQDKSKEAIKDWTQEEKYHLLKGLKTHGRHDFEKIQEHVPTKTLEEVKAAVEYYTGVALQHPIFVKETGQKPRRSRKPHSPLTDWAKLLTDHLSYSELSTETATAVRMIADLEKIPPPECTDGIDFRKVYHQIANAMEGKPLNVDLSTAAVLHKCLIETALSSKAFIKTAAFRYIINNIDLSDKEINTFPRPTEDHELATLRHLASQRSYNPLKVPEENLKPSTVLEERRPR
ncbi:hypothetical protein PYW08_012839 [Mythimna loreyi]|uniref:Uncharacterized protein n=1 Tax=Mythimna loreyi TaxID=667449 RepID=A0ACC2Q1W0_9NEOP|nr:hypothetical protein PYW08_012839 [Mythimna loreyi]